MEHALRARRASLRGPDASTSREGERSGRRMQRFSTAQYTGARKGPLFPRLSRHLHGSRMHNVAQRLYGPSLSIGRPSKNPIITKEEFVRPFSRKENGVRLLRNAAHTVEKNLVGYGERLTASQDHFFDDVWNLGSWGRQFHGGLSVSLPQPCAPNQTRYFPPFLPSTNPGRANAVTIELSRPPLKKVPTETSATSRRRTARPMRSQTSSSDGGSCSASDSSQISK